MFRLVIFERMIL